MRRLSGIAVSRGFVSGPVFLCGCGEDLAVPEYTVPSESILAELARFHDACCETRRQIEALTENLRSRTDGKEVAIFENHLLFLSDPVIVSSVEQAIRVEQLNAEAAVRKAVSSFRAVFEKMSDVYLRERVRDIDDLERRILKVLLGCGDNPFAAISSPVVVVAPDLTPSETVSLPRDLILGFATDRGSSTSHVALLARALGIPAVCGLGDVTSKVHAGDEVLLDGTDGVITVNPDSKTKEDFRVLAERDAALLSQLGKGAGGESLGIHFLANAQPGLPLDNLRECGAEGIGLYRTEYLWLSDNFTPDEDSQTATYVDAVKAASMLGSGCRTVFRVLDLGGDKLVRGVKSQEANPFLGNRSLRWLLTHKKVFRTQLRAILRASAHGPVSIMYPMVAAVEELLAANAELTDEMALLRSRGVKFDETLTRGCMIETPSAALNAARFAREVDFFSVGTNDLVQYTMAADRGNEQVSHLLQPSNPAVLKLVDITFRAAHDAGIVAGVCGESASDPVFGVIWAALGADVLSMSPSYIPMIRKTLSVFSRAELDAVADDVRSCWDDKNAAGIYTMVKERIALAIPDVPVIAGASLEKGR